MLADLQQLDSLHVHLMRVFRLASVYPLRRRRIWQPAIFQDARSYRDALIAAI